MRRVSELAAVRAGRHNNHAVLCVVALEPDHYGLLEDSLSLERLHHEFAPLQLEQIRRFELPELGLLQFVLVDAYVAVPHHWLLASDAAPAGGILQDLLLTE